MDNLINATLDDYEKNSLNKVIKNNIDSVFELQRQFDDYMDQYDKKRRDADDFSVQVTGLTNPQRYEMQMDKLLKEDVNITDQMIADAKKWSVDSNITILYPTKDIDDLFNKFEDQPESLKRKADFKALDLYGIDNETLYYLLKNNHKLDIINFDDYQDYDSFSLGHKLDQLNSFQPTDLTESSIKKYNTKKILNKIKENYNRDNNFKWEFIYAPFFDPREIQILEGFYSTDVDDSTNEFLKEYTNYYFGYQNEFNILKWDSKIRELYYKLEYCTDHQERNRLKQSIVNMGWNPEIPYNEQNQIKAKKRLESIISNMYEGVAILDIQSLYNSFNESEVITESKKQKLYPISIILSKGPSKLSDLIANATDGPFSHAAICIDGDLKRLYSFNMDNKINKSGGFSLESIKDYSRENRRIAIFTFFVNEESYTAISNNIQSSLYNIKNSVYSVKNIITLPFKNINLNRSNAMICSQFVDKMLKIANIDITNKDSSKVTPNYLYNISLKNARIYKVYDGSTDDFNIDKASKFINSMARKSKPINETFDIVKEYTINQYLYPTICEAKQVPLQFKDNGDLIVNNPFIDFDTEYFSSHKLLLQYEKTNNIDGMKYELARLYYMNYILEKRIYSYKFNNKREDNIKTRARILNDFSKYLAIVLKTEPNFNFAKYYEDSIFSANTFEIKGATLKKFKDIIKSIVK